MNPILEGMVCVSCGEQATNIHQHVTYCDTHRPKPTSLEILLTDEGLPLLFKPSEIATWVHDRILDLMENPALEPEDMRRALFRISRMSGTLATQPTDIGSHVGCNLGVRVIEEQFFRKCGVDRADGRTLLMPAGDRYEVVTPPEIREIFCIDHERVIEEGREHMFEMDWS